MPLTLIQQNVCIPFPMKYTIHQIVTQLESNQYYADVVKNKKSILVTSNDYQS